MRERIFFSKDFVHCLLREEMNCTQKLFLFKNYFQVAVGPDNSLGLFWRDYSHYWRDNRFFHTIKYSSHAVRVDVLLSSNVL